MNSAWYNIYAAITFVVVGEWEVVWSFMGCAPLPLFFEVLMYPVDTTS